MRQGWPEGYRDCHLSTKHPLFIAAQLSRPLRAAPHSRPLRAAALETAASMVLDYSKFDNPDVSDDDAPKKKPKAEKG